MNAEFFTTIPPPIPLPIGPAELFVTVLFSSRTLAAPWALTPPPELAELPEMVQLSTVTPPVP
jgi:hypothetical protein